MICGRTLDCRTSVYIFMFPICYTGLDRSLPPAWGQTRGRAIRIDSRLCAFGGGPRPGPGYRTRRGRPADGSELGQSVKTTLHVRAEGGGMIDA